MKALLFVFILLPCVALAQPPKSKCGFFIKDSAAFREGYQKYYQHLGVKEGERVASVGAASGSVELNISSYVKNVTWTLQDIDTACLNVRVFNQFKDYDEQLLARKIEGDFDFVLGEEKSTRLPRNQYDRILLVNVYHELTEREALMQDLKGALKENGVVAIQERMATKRKQKHGDCGHPKLMEAALVEEMDRFGFVLEKKTQAEQMSQLCYYVFKLK